MIKLARIEDIPEGRGLLVTSPTGEKLALFKEGEDVFAIQDACPHKGASLAEGTVDEGVVTCPLHAWEFCLNDGHCLTYPGRNVRRYPLLIDNGNIFLLTDN